MFSLLLIASPWRSISVGINGEKREGTASKGYEKGRCFEYRHTWFNDGHVKLEGPYRYLRKMISK